MPSDQPNSTATVEWQAGTLRSPLHSDCDAFSLQLAAVADGGSELDSAATGHFESCLRCQAELVQYKKLLRALASLRTHRLRVDETLVSEIINALEPGGTVHRLQRLVDGSKTRKVAYIGGIAAAGAAGAFVIATRLASRQRLAGC